MGTTWEMDVEIKPTDTDKRQNLTGQIDMALMIGGVRVGAGTYRVRIEKITSPKRRAHVYNSEEECERCGKQRGPYDQSPRNSGCEGR